MSHQIGHQAKRPNKSKKTTCFNGTAATENPFDKEWKNSDVIVKVGDQTLYLHSGILSHHSPVFDAMLNGNFKEGINKEVELIGKEPKFVIQMFTFFYAELFPTVSGYTDFENLLPLFREYQLQWLIDASEKQIQTADSIDLITKFYFSEEYDLKNLMKSLLEVPVEIDFGTMQNRKHWDHLSNRLKQKIAFKRFPNKKRPHVISGFDLIGTHNIQSFPKSYNKYSTNLIELNTIKTFLESELDRLYELIDNDEARL